MCKAICALSRDHTYTHHLCKVCFEGDLSQADNYADLGQCCEFCRQMRCAVTDLLWRRLIPRWSTSKNCSDPRIAQLQPVFARDCSRLGRKPNVIQHRVKKISRSVPGKHSSCTVCTVSTRRQPQNQYGRLWIA